MSYPTWLYFAQNSFDVVDTQFAVYNGVSYNYKNATIMGLLALQW